tara:strand:- start:9375 stop:9641 length:267 start_codon:yes stop_codon:yes gene_type:complete
MRKENIKTTALTVLFAGVGGLLTLSIYTSGYIQGKQEGREVEESVHYEAIQECMEELENECPQLYDYAVTLERENARLNKKCIQQLAH